MMKMALVRDWMKLVHVAAGLAALVLLCQASVVNQLLLRPLLDPPAVSNVVQVPWPKVPAGMQALVAFHVNGTYRSTGRPYQAAVALINDLSKFAFALPPNGCVNHTNVSVAAQLLNCQWATNGGFFTFTPPACEGNIIIDGQPVELQPSANINFGVTRNNSTVVGFLSAADVQNNTFGFQQLLAGSGLVVHRGASNVNHSADIDPTSKFVTEKAPRTALGLLSNGSVLSVAVDGVESLDEGPDLFELAELMILLGAQEAINLDGGGSTTAVFNGQVYNRPTCEDLPLPVCERNVTTIVCVRQ